MSEPRPPLALTPEQEGDFKKRLAAWDDWKELHPQATNGEVDEYLNQLKPANPDEARLFDGWMMKKTLGRINTEEGRGFSL